MYTSYIGQKFLDIYNRRMNSAYTAVEFFDTVMFPLFFDDARHLMHVSNSPFFQTPPEKELKQSALSKSAYQYQKLKQKISLVAEAATENADASIYVGFAANGPDQTTAGQVSNLRWKITSDELYASWIGNALAARVEGSQCLLLDSEPALWHLFQGWQVYRKYMEPLKTMEGRQIETWNGYWLAKGELNKPPEPPQKGGKIDTYPWVEAIAKLLQWHAGDVLPAYIFSLGQTNTTYGFINLHLPQLRRLTEARHAIKKTLLSTADESDAFFWEHYEPELSLRDVCQLGEVGLRGLRPKDYGRMMEEGLSTLKINDKNRHTFSNIQTWIIAMLNNKSDLQKLAADLATELVAAELSGTSKERGKTSDAAETKALFEAKGVTNFIIGLTDFLEKHSAAANVCRSVVNQSIRIPGEQFPLFKALLRFEYVFLKSNK
jgi:hypothetical protein